MCVCVCTTMENTYNDSYETHIITVAYPSLGSVWLYVWCSPQRAIDRGYKLGSALPITMIYSINRCEIIYRPWVRIPTTSFMPFIILDDTLYLKPVVI